ncbi:hypothetical protein E5288_WYG003061 [Bos mutus]|uniref:Uncharacterized protein n=1 Tax=Bos mutus TaxID=72004 RepID=A0A6B0RBX9_9CETA|nr:hypothetical protein [Bos mutus]
MNQQPTSAATGHLQRRRCLPLQNEHRQMDLLKPHREADWGPERTAVGSNLLTKKQTFPYFQPLPNSLEEDTNVGGHDEVELAIPVSMVTPTAP